MRTKEKIMFICKKLFVSPCHISSVTPAITMAQDAFNINVVCIKSKMDKDIP